MQIRRRLSAWVLCYSLLSMCLSGMHSLRSRWTKSLRHSVACPQMEHHAKWQGAKEARMILFFFLSFFRQKKRNRARKKKRGQGAVCWFFCVYTTAEPERRHSQGGEVSGAARCRPTAGGNGQSQKPSRGQTARGQRRLRPRRSREGASRPRAPRALRPRAVAS